jgi:hypothetical protein
MRSDPGFSVVEVLAALVVTSLTIVGLTPFVSQMFATWTRGSEVARAVELKTHGLGLLREDIRHALVWTGTTLPESPVSFNGDATSLRFPATTGIGFGRRGFEMLSITVDPSRDGLALVRRHAALVGSSPAHFRDPVILFSGPFKFAFQYKSRSGEETAVWTDTSEIPASIKLTIFDRRGSIFLVPIEFPIFASLSAGCLAISGLPGCPANETME